MYPSAQKKIGPKGRRESKFFYVDPGADPGFGQGGAPGAEAESCRRSEAELREWSEQFAAGVQGPLKGPGSFWVLMLKYAFSHILETLFL